MPKFRIGIWEERSGYTIVTASSKAAAQRKVQKILDEDGIAGFDDYNPMHRDTDILECEKE